MLDGGQLRTQAVTVLLEGGASAQTQALRNSGSWIRFSLNSIQLPWRSTRVSGRMLEAAELLRVELCVWSPLVSGSDRVQV